MEILYYISLAMMIGVPALISYLIIHFKKDKKNNLKLGKSESAHIAFIVFFILIVLIFDHISENDDYFAEKIYTNCVIDYEIKNKHTIPTSYECLQDIHEYVRNAEKTSSKIEALLSALSLFVTMIGVFIIAGFKPTKAISKKEDSK